MGVNMKVIRKLTDQIEDELCGVKEYIECAMNKNRISRIIKNLLRFISSRIESFFNTS
jgi:hypothetical protein